MFMVWIGYVVGLSRIRPSVQKVTVEVHNETKPKVTESDEKNCKPKVNESEEK